MIDLSALPPLAELMASEQGVHPDLWDDAVQEGMIRAWLTTEQRPDASPQYVHTAMRHGVRGLSTGRSHYGAPSRQGRREPLDTHFEQMPEEESHSFITIAPYDRVEELADVDVDAIRKAVKGLTARDQWLVHLRFTKDLSWPEMSKEMAPLGRGTGANALRKRFQEHIAPTLREVLSVNE